MNYEIYSYSRLNPDSLTEKNNFDRSEKAGQADVDFVVPLNSCNQKSTLVRSMRSLSVSSKKKKESVENAALHTQKKKGAKPSSVFVPLH